MNGDEERANSRSSGRGTDTEDELEKLGRQRPEVFARWWSEVGFCVAILGSNMLGEFLVSGFNVLLPVLLEDTGIDSNQKTWPSTVFSLVTGALLLPFGRLSDLLGGYPVFVGGLVWMVVWSIAGGFSRTLPILLATRALQGIGAAAYLPAGITLLATTYRPGPRKNVVFSLYGGCAPFGFFFGIFIAGLSGQFLYWGWYFWIAAMLLALLCGITILCVPRSFNRVRLTGASIDIWGTVLSVSSLALLTYAITDASHVERGWASPQILAPLIAGIITLAAFVYVEGWVAENPLLPPSLFAIRYTKPLFLSLFIAYGCFGIFLLYASFYIETVLNVQPLLAAAWFAPLAAGGIAIALVGGLVLHRLPGTVLLILSASGFLISVLLFALIPDDPNYWAWIFPAMVCATIGVDISYNVSGIFLTTSVPKHQQGLAGACINGLVFLGMSFFLGWTDFAVLSSNKSTPAESYKVAFWFGVGCACTVIVITLLFIRIGGATSSLTADEKAAAAELEPTSEEPGILAK